MRTRSLWVALVLVSMGASARAESPRKSGDAKAAPAIRTDARGVTGVSPLWERLGKGDRAVLARDLDGALAAYREAVAASPESALAHYRVAQALAAKGELKEADTAYATALRFTQSDPNLRAKVLFCLADLRERQRATDEALERWADYEALAKSQPKAKTYPASAAERKQRNQDWKKLSADSAEVKSRIEQRLRAAEAAVKKSAK